MNVHAPTQPTSDPRLKYRLFSPDTRKNCTRLLKPHESYFENKIKAYPDLSKRRFSAGPRDEGVWLPQQIFRGDRQS